MDSNDQERERGITILAKAASVTGSGVQDQPRRHARPRRLRRRGRAGAGAWSTACCCSSTRPRARCPRRATCCRRRSPRDLPAVVVLNKVDRQDARADEVLDEIYQLFLDLDAADDDIDFPVISAVAREGRAMAGVGMPAADADLTPLFEAILDDRPGARRRPERAAAGASSPTSTPRTTSAGWPIGRVVQGRLRRRRAGRAARRGVDEGEAPLRAQAHAAHGLRGHRAASTSTSCVRRRPVRASPASPRSRSATRSPTRPTPCRCRASSSTSRCCA